jgi:E3 ubiquitin-protein ligase NEDD4
VTNQSVISVQVFDQKKFKKRDQGFLGVVTVQMGNAFDVAVGGDGKFFLSQLGTFGFFNAF